VTHLYIGTSGYSYKDWRDIFYPKGLAQKNWLAHYASHFNTVEINATFYRHFRREIFERWRSNTPDDFKFTLKGPKPITHVNRLEDVDALLTTFVESAMGLGDKLSAMLWQMPPSYKRESPQIVDQLAGFLALLPKDVRQVMEFRHASWFDDSVYELLDQYGVGFCINDSNRWPAREVHTGGFSYVRFHGPERLYASLYTVEQMQAWAEKLAPRLAVGDVYAYFNNDYAGRALHNARELRALLTDTPLPPAFQLPSSSS
jgi:uncharacterized protein YecE (DUF72 family)